MDGIESETGGPRDGDGAQPGEAGQAGQAGEAPGGRAADDPVVRLALGHVRANVASLPASELVQLVLWPRTLAELAADAAADEAVVSNMFRRFRAYRDVRARVAACLGVSVGAIAAVVDRPAAPPVPARVWERQVALGAEAPGGGLEPGESGNAPSTGVARDARRGDSPLELAALERAPAAIIRMPASRVVRLCLFPESIASWARRQGTPLERVLRYLSGHRENRAVERALAHRLRLPAATLGRFVTPDRDWTGGARGDDPRRGRDRGEGTRDVRAG